MKSVKNILVLAAAGLLMTACGNNNTPASSTTPASSSTPASSVTTGASRNVAIDFTNSSANLAGVSIFGSAENAKYTNKYAYCPHVGEAFYVVPSFFGAFELDYVELDGTRYEAKVGTSEMAFGDYTGTLPLNGIRYAEVKMSDGAAFSACTIKVVGKEVANATLKKVTLNTTNNCYTPGDDDNSLFMRTYIDGSMTPSWVSVSSTEEVSFIPGTWVTFTVAGKEEGDMEAFHDQSYSGGPAATAKCTTTLSNEGKVIGNTLEYSIDKLMHTTRSFMMPSDDVTVNVTFDWVAK